MTKDNRLVKRHLTNANERTVAEKIHKDGREAYKNGFRLSDNPYEKCNDIYSLKHVAWKNWGNGFRFAHNAKCRANFGKVVPFRF